MNQLFISECKHKQIFPDINAKEPQWQNSKWIYNLANASFVATSNNGN